MNIPFIHQLSNEEAQAWQSAFAKQLPTHPLKDFRQMSVTERLGADLAVVANPNPEHLAEFPNLIWIQSLWAGVEKILENSSQSSVEIARMVDPALSATMSESVLAWVFYLQRSMPHYRVSQAAVRWAPLPYRAPKDVKVLILGMGEMGSASARRLAENGFQVCGWSRTAKSFENLNCIQGTEALVNELSSTQILVNLLPLTPQTTKMIDRSLLEKLPDGASLINFGRGASLNIEDLMTLLDADHLNHAILDVFTREPLDQTDPLWKHPKITILPHIAAPTAIDSATLIAARNISNYIEQGKKPAFVSRHLGY